MGEIDGATVFEGGSNGCVGELACCVVSANEFVVVRFAFSGNVGA